MAQSLYKELIIYRKISLLGSFLPTLHTVDIEIIFDQITNCSVKKTCLLCSTSIYLGICNS